MKHPIQNLLLAAILVLVLSIIYAVITDNKVLGLISEILLVLCFLALIKRRKIEAPLPEYKPDYKLSQDLKREIPKDEAFD